MSRILFAAAALTPTAALSHAGRHDFAATDTLLHSVLHADHALALLAVLTLPIAAVVLIRNRRK